MGLGLKHIMSMFIMWSCPLQNRHFFRPRRWLWSKVSRICAYILFCITTATEVHAHTPSVPPAQQSTCQRIQLSSCQRPLREHLCLSVGYILNTYSSIDKRVFKIFWHGRSVISVTFRSVPLPASLVFPIGLHSSSTLTLPHLSLICHPCIFQ